MSISKTLKDYVNSDERNLDDIRDSLFFAATRDPGFETGGDFELSLNYCLENGILESELFQEDDGREIPSDITEENFSTICAALRTNFSIEKLTAAKKMGRILYSEEQENVKKNTSPQNEATRVVHRTERRNSQTARPTGNNKIKGNEIPTGAIIAATVAVVAIGVTIAVIAG